MTVVTVFSGGGILRVCSYQIISIVSCDVVFDETNGSQVEQVDLDEIGNEEAPCIALRNMSIGDVCPKESEESPNAQDQPSSSTQASPPTQTEDEAQIDEVEDHTNEPPQDDDNDQGGDANTQDKEDEEPRPPHPRVHQAIQRDHPVDTILGDIHKGVTTRYLQPFHPIAWRMTSS